MNTGDLLVNRDYFPNINVGDTVQIKQKVKIRNISNNVTNSDLSMPKFDIANGESEEHEEKTKMQSIILTVYEAKHNMKGIPQLSILESICKKFGLESRKSFTLSIISDEPQFMLKTIENRPPIYIDICEIKWKGVFFSSVDQFKLRRYIIDKLKSVYVGKEIKRNFHVSALYRLNKSVNSGLITNHTRFFFRTSSSEFYLLFQICTEMWEETNEGGIYFERAVNGFLKQLLDLWENQKLTHLLRIVFFTRIDFSQFKHIFLNHYKEKIIELRKYASETGKTSFVLNFLEEGKVDFYKKLNLRGEDGWNSELDYIKEEFSKFLGLVRNTFEKEFKEFPKVLNFIKNDYVKILSNAANCNFFEVINLILNKYCTHNINRHMHHSGQQFIVISPGTGVFEVKENFLEELTKKRSIENGVTIKVVCLSDPPSHLVPIFKCYFKKDTIKYIHPQWFDLSFYTEKSTIKENKMGNGLKIDNSNAKSKNQSLVHPPKKESYESTAPYYGFGNQNNEKLVFSPFIRMPAIQRVSEKNAGSLHNIRIFQEKKNAEVFSKHDESIFSVENEIRKDEKHENGLLERHEDEHLLGKFYKKDTIVEYLKAEELRILKEKGAVTVKRLRNPFQFESNEIVLEKRSHKNNIQLSRGDISKLLTNCIRFHETHESNEKYQIPPKYHPHWQFMCEPPVLGLETPFWLAQKDFIPHKVYYIDIKMDPDLEVERKKLMKVLFEELVAQRLQQNYQLHYRSNYGKKYKLSLMDSYHELELGEKYIKVRIARGEYAKKEAPKRGASRDYKYYLFLKVQKQFVEKNVSFKLKEEFEWNVLDRVVAGFAEELDISIHPRIIQFHLIPQGIFKGKRGNENQQKKKKISTVTRFKEVLKYFTNRHFKFSKYEKEKEMFGAENLSVYNENVESGKNAIDNETSQEMLEKKKEKDFFINIIEKKENLKFFPTRNACLNKFFKLVDEINKKDGERFEWVRMYYKDNYSSNECYPFQIKWLVSNSVSIDTYIKYIKRNAERLGFLLVKTPYFPIDITISLNKRFYIQTKEEKVPFLNLRSFEKHPKIELSKKLEERIRIMEMVCVRMHYLSEIFPITKYSKRFVSENGKIVLQIEDNRFLYFIENSYEIDTHFNSKKEFGKLKRIIEIETKKIESEKIETLIKKK